MLSRMADSRLVDVENPMKSPKSKLITIDKLALQAISKMCIKMQNVYNGQSYFEKEPS